MKDVEEFIIQMRSNKKMKEEIKRLEQISDFYAKGDYMDNLLVDREVILIQKLMRSKLNALEVGCAGGYSTAKLFPCFNDFEVVEPSRKNMEMMLKRVGQKITCHNVLLEDFHTDRQFDNIIYLNVIEHVEHPVEDLSRLGRLLSDEGLIYITAPNCMSRNRRAGYEMGILPSYDQMAPKDYELGHRRLYTVEMMADHIRQAGLDLVAMKGVYLKPLSEKQMIALGDAAVRAFYALGEDVPQYCANIFAVAGKKKAGTK